MKLLLISGSLRANSTNSAVLRTVAALATDQVRAVLYGGINDLPHYNPDLDVEPLPAAVTALRSQLREADAVLFCTPEYAGDLPGSFKNALDWMVGGTEIGGMPVGWINVSSPASPKGGEDAHNSLRRVLGYVTAKIVEEACVRLPLQRSDVGVDGLIGSPEIRRQLAGVMDRLAAEGRRAAFDQTA